MQQNLGNCTQEEFGVHRNKFPVWRPANIC